MDVDEPRRAELRKFVTEEYVDFAFNLPPLASTTFWQLMKHRIRPASGELSNRFCDLDNLIAFLSDYFSTELVREISKQLTSLSDSILGPDHAWRKGKGEFACGVIEDIIAKQAQDNGPLKGFWGYAMYTSSDSEGDGSEPQAGVKKHSPSTVEPPQEHFSSIPEVTIDLPAFQLTVRERATLFGRHPRLREHEATGPVFHPYDPSPKGGQARLYHGTFRSEWVKGFKTRGMAPLWTEGHEFHNGPAFYTTNCPCIAYEQPLHNHLGSFRQPDDHPVVLEFVVDVKTLCGQRCIPGTDEKFRVLRFDEASDGVEWAGFCRGNIRFRGKRNAFDIVIGPLCEFTAEEVVFLKISATGGDGSVAQLAFCSTRSRLWLETCLQRVYCEDRKSFGNVV